MIQHPRTLDRPYTGRLVGGPIPAGNQLGMGLDPFTTIELISVRIRLVTSAAAGNRFIRLIIGPPPDEDVSYICPVSHPPSTTIDYWWMRGPVFPTPTAVSGRWCGPLGLGIIFSDPYQLTTDIVNFDAGDQITLYNIRWRRWMDPVF